MNNDDDSKEIYKILAWEIWKRINPRDFTVDDLAAALEDIDAEDDVIRGEVLQ